jgi:hypothetical protein
LKVTLHNLLVIGSILLLLAAGFGAGWLTAMATPEPQRIPWPDEVQQMLKATGIERYDPGPIDGIPGPRMKQGWLNYTFDYKYAMPHFEAKQ